VPFRYKVSIYYIFIGMGMQDPKPTFATLFTHLRDTHPDMAYLHVVEPRISGDSYCDVHAHESNDFLREIWKPRPFMSAGGYNKEQAIEAAESTGDLIGFGRLFISNVRIPSYLLCVILR